MRFNSREYVDNFVRTGRFPSIHDDIFDAVRNIGETFDKAIDLGCCTGLLSQRLISSGIAKYVIGVEPNASYLEYAVSNDRIKYLNFGLCPDVLERFIPHLDGAGLIVARRVFPEISDTSGVGFVHQLSEIFHMHGVRYIAVEGRKPVRNPANKLYSLEREIECFKRSYDVFITNNNCVILKRV